jgi:hypothetical protein
MQAHFYVILNVIDFFFTATTSSAFNKPGPSHRKEVVDEAPLAEQPAIGKHLWWISFIVVNV